MKVENKWGLFILFLIVLLFLVNILEASGQTITDIENLTIVKDFYYCESDNCYYAYVSSSEYNLGAFKVSGESVYEKGDNVYKRNYDGKYVIGANSVGYIKISEDTLSFIDNASCPISYLDFLNNNVLTIPENVTISIPSDVELDVSNIVFSGSNKGILINNGIINIQGESDLSIRGNIQNNNTINITKTNITFDCNQENGKTVTFNNTATGVINLVGELENETTSTNYTFKVSTTNYSSDDGYYINDGEINGNKYDMDLTYTSNYKSINVGTVKLGDGDLKISGQGGNTYELDVLAANTIYLSGDNAKMNITDNAIFDEIVHSNGSGIMTVDISEGANIFVKNISTKITFKLAENSSLSYCVNPTHQIADWGNSYYLAELSNHSTLNYVAGEYTYDGSETTPLDEKDIKINTTNGQHKGKKKWEWWDSFDDFWSWIFGRPSSDVHETDEDDVIMYAAYETPEACKIAHSEEKSILLPITLTYFKIDGNQFEWETASEDNNNFFVVEYSRNGIDWTVCTDRQYSMSDNGWVYDCAVPEWTKESTFSYYRLKQVDLDGKTSYSDIISMSWNIESPTDINEGEYSKVYISSDGKIIYGNYNEFPAGVYIEKSGNGIRRIVKVK